MLVKSLLNLLGIVSIFYAISSGEKIKHLLNLSNKPKYELISVNRSNSQIQVQNISKVNNKVISKSNNKNNKLKSKGNKDKLEVYIWWYHYTYEGLRVCGLSKKYLCSTKNIQLRKLKVTLTKDLKWIFSVRQSKGLGKSNDYLSNYYRGAKRYDAFYWKRDKKDLIARAKGDNMNNFPSENNNWTSGPLYDKVTKAILDKYSVYLK